MLPKLRKLLEPNFIEARLHTDYSASHPNYKYDARIQEMRTKYLGKGNIGIPQYVILDPNHLDNPRAKKLDGALGGLPAFKKFLKRALPTAGN